MFYKKIILLVLLIYVIIGNMFGDNNINFTLEIDGVTANNGRIYVKIYSNDRDYRNDNPFSILVLESTEQNIAHIFELPEGEYLIVLFQDTNGNGILDTNILGIPREPSGISNYSGGIPVGWNKHKFQVNINFNRLTINIGRL